MVPGDGVHQLVLEDGQAVAQADGDAAPQVFLGLEEQAVVALGRVVRGELGQGAVDVLDALMGQKLVHVPQSPLFNGEQIALGVLQIHHVVDQRHEEIQLRAAPEVVCLTGPRGVLDDGVGHRLGQLGVLVQPIQAVPTVGVGHVQEVHRLDVVAVLFEIGGQLFKELLQ